VIREASRRSAEVGATNFSFQTGDFRDAGLRPGTFDVVLAHQALQYLSDPVGAIAAMAAFVRRNGIVAVRDGDSGAFTWSPANRGLERGARSTQRSLDITAANQSLGACCSAGHVPRAGRM
jgi:SAM-dependent methyltransferase